MSQRFTLRTLPALLFVLAFGVSSAWPQGEALTTLSDEGETAATAAPTTISQRYAIPPIAATYKMFWYSIGEDGRVMQEQIDGTEAGVRRTMEIEGKWIPIYTEFLQGNFEAYVDDEENPISREKAQQMVPQEMVRSLINRPNAQAKRARQMAEWALYYEQLDRWHTFVENRILQTKLGDEEKVSENPQELHESLAEAYAKMREHAVEIMEEQTQAYRDMLDSVRQNQEEQAAYEAWAKGSREAMQAFAAKWARQFNGSELRIGGTLFFVRNVEEVPAKGEEDVFRDTLPPNAVLLDVPKAKVVTPFDLLNADGSLRTPVGTSGM